MLFYSTIFVDPVFNGTYLKTMVKQFYQLIPLRNQVVKIARMPGQKAKMSMINKLISGPLNHR